MPEHLPARPPEQAPKPRLPGLQELLDHIKAIPDLAREALGRLLGTVETELGIDPRKAEGGGRQSESQEKKETNSDAGLREAIPLIGKLEGLRLDAYPDPVTKGKPYTIGYGNTFYQDGRPVKLGDRITTQEAEQLLQHTLRTNFLPAAQRIPGWSSMHPKMQAALLSFMYNNGANIYGHPQADGFTAILKNKEWEKLGDKFQEYVNVYKPSSSGASTDEKVRVLGLVNRRKEEAALWNKGLQELKKTDRIG